MVKQKNEFKPTEKWIARDEFLALVGWTLGTFTATKCVFKRTNKLRQSKLNKVTYFMKDDIAKMLPLDKQVLLLK